MASVSPFWLRHLEAIAAENITTKAYAQREGLPVWRLYDTRQKLARQRKALATQPHAAQPDCAFVSVQLPVQQSAPSPSHPTAAACRLQLRGGIHLDFTHLPEVHWLSQLIHALPATTGEA